MSAAIIPHAPAFSADSSSPESGHAESGHVSSSRSLACSPFARTDLGNAERLVARHGDDLLFTGTHGWLVWDGMRWAPDETGEVMRFAKETVRSIYFEAGDLAAPDDRSAVAEHAIESEGLARLRAMVTLAETEKRVAITAAALDRDPWLLNVQNGTIDLRSGELRPHQRDDRITKLARVVYDPAASCPRFETFLEQVQPDPERRAYLQRLAGYACTGLIREHVLPVLHGEGRNGKGVFTNTLQHVLGDYALTVPSELLMAKKNDEHPTGRSDLLGCRLAVASETEQNRALATSLVKLLTGGDPIAARRMHKDFFRFLPTHKLLLATNHRPVIKETKDAIWDRVHLIPWEVRIPPEQQDLELGDKLKVEAPGILRWMIEGCLEWQRTGLAPPPSVVAATKKYRTDMDSLGDFLEECCVLEPKAHVSRATLRAAYERWAEDLGHRHTLDPRSFGDALRERGCTVIKVREPSRASHPIRGWGGIRLRKPDESVDTEAGRGTDPADSAPIACSETDSPEPRPTADYVTTGRAGTPSVPAPADADDEREVFDL